MLQMTQWYQYFHISANYKNMIQMVQWYTCISTRIFMSCDGCILCHIKLILGTSVTLTPSHLNKSSQEYVQQALSSFTLNIENTNEKVGRCLRDDTMMFKCIGQDDLVRRWKVFEG